ncbi:DUF3429 domain-containing protein [Plastoroseomonas arctica]|uniref:DUF3429 domain-containing protein n=1 Tax=Plastoroseomonas arctica TaxID=1509237 RepID=A0AAF1JZQ4_9PROT|nr:DUF3429 domain-containing protein [Plastoroseomonas arctica]MBR0656018.1 DUF3429 domain-containing protein [Plastoroseomonas arctica]
MRDLPVPARIFGLAGLLPFLALAIGCWFRPAFGFPLSAYGATILAFLGAVHWGFALSDGRAPWGRFGLGVVPALVAWVALLLPLVAGLLVLAAGIASTALVERLAARRGLVPSPYLALRLVLSGGAVFGLLLGAIALA